MSIVSEFKTFIMRGNVVDLAVGVVIGAAFGAIVTSFVKDVLSPPLGLLTGGINFTEMRWVLKSHIVDLGNGQTETKIDSAINYGIFINNVISFLIQAAAIFVMVKIINIIHKKKDAAPAAPAAPTKSEELLTEIRDLLAKK